MLFAGDFIGWSTCAGLAEGFRLLGWDVAEASVTQAETLSPRRDLRAAGRLLRRFARRSYNTDILDQAATLGPQIFLTVKGVGVTRETLETLRAAGIFTVNFYPDYKFDYDGFDPDTFDAYDLVVTSKSFQVGELTRRLGSERVAMVHHGYVPQFHRRRVPAGEDVQYLWDICFIGNASADKLRWIERVARAFGDRRFLVVGAGWDRIAHGTAVAPHVFGGPLHGDHFARATEHSRVNIAVHHGAGGSHGWADLVSTRTFEIPACGGFMLHIDNPEVRGLYDVGQEIDVFSDPDQLCGLIETYLADEPRRRAMADAAHARAVPAYSLHSRAAEIAAILTGNPIVDRARKQGQ